MCIFIFSCSSTPSYATIEYRRTLLITAGTVAIEGGRGGNTLSGLPLNLSEKPQACWLPRLSVNEGSLCVLVTAGTAGQRLLVTVVRTTKPSRMSPV